MLSLFLVRQMFAPLVAFYQNEFADAGSDDEYDSMRENQVESREIPLK